MKRAAAMAEKMSAQLRVRGRTLKEVTARAGRKLPRRMKAEAEILIEAETLAGHPKLRSRLDERRLARAERRLTKYLEKQNPSAERWGMILDQIAKVAFVLLAVGLVVFVVLLRRGAFN